MLLKLVALCVLHKSDLTRPLILVTLCFYLPWLRQGKYCDVNDLRPRWMLILLTSLLEANLRVTLPALVGMVLIFILFLNNNIINKYDNVVKSLI
jgi:hypothetical protein